MWEVRACRVCLARDCRLDPPDKHRLRRAYETVAGLPLVEECGMPQWLCAECAHSLRKWSAFRSRCRRADAVLRAIYDTHKQITEEEIAKVDRRAAMLTSPLAVLRLVPLVIEPSHCFKTEVKGEESTAGLLKLEVDVPVEKVELLATFSPLPPESDHDPNLSKDEPLIEDGNLKKSKSKNPKEPKTRPAKRKTTTAKSRAVPKAKTQTDGTAKKKSENKSYPRSFYEEFATITTPTREQQLEEIEKRRETDNYKYSPFKCTFCYKGFVDEAAFKNHTMKHDPVSGDLECDICRCRFRRRRFLSLHVARNHTHRYKCRSCEHVCPNPSQARLHENWHKGKRYQCPHCDDSFLKLTSYMSHLRKKHPSQFVCDICGNAFVSEMGVRNHKSLAHRHQKVSMEGPYCGECDVRFASEDAFKVHLVSSAKHNLEKKVTLSPYVQQKFIKKFACDKCEASFKHKYRLALHKECKHPMKQEDCDSNPAYGWACNVRISTEEALKRHTGSSAKHSPNNEFGCESKMELTAHCRSHDKRVPVDAKRDGIVKCKQCDASFLTSSGCYWHFKKTHPGMEYPMKTIYMCEVCGKYWPSKAALRSHQTKHTSEKPLQCSHCPKRFGERSTLEAHARTHTGEKPFACPRCPKRFRIRQLLRHHERTHTGERPYPCDICRKAFKIKGALKRHMLVHTGVKSHECERCGKAFSQLSAVKLHVRTVHLKLPAPPRGKRRRRQPASTPA